MSTLQALVERRKSDPVFRSGYHDAKNGTIKIMESSDAYWMGVAKYAIENGSESTINKINEAIA